MCFKTINICLIISLVLVVHMSSIVKAQDQLILHTAEEIKVKIFEIGTEEISYKRKDNPEGPMFKVAKGDVFLIIFENGTTWKSDGQTSVKESKSNLTNVKDESELIDEKELAV